MDSAEFARSGTRSTNGVALSARVFPRVDVACLGIIMWVASGMIMWWRLPRLRTWGAIAVGGGILSFGLLVWTL